jgi:alpha-glucosidase
MKNRLFSLSCAFFAILLTHAAPLSLPVSITSPDGRLKVTVNASETVTWQITYDGQQVLLPSAIGIEWSQGKDTKDLGLAGKCKPGEHNGSFQNRFYKKETVSDSYRYLLLYTNRHFTIEIRAYNDGAAYRLLTNNKRFTVKKELAEFAFPGDPKAFIPYVNDLRGGERCSFSFESYYDEQPLSQMFSDSLAITPFAVCLDGGLKAVVMDCGVENYPGMMLLKNGKTLKADFAPYPLEQDVLGFGGLNYTPTKRADFIAKIAASKTEIGLPWRALVVTAHDADILNSDMAQRLAPACRVKDTSWIKPGKVAWDWWNNTNISGVEFKSGMNTATYLYYIDFAAQNKLEYIIIDEGWSGSENLMEKLNPEIDLKRLIAYGQEKGVGIILWSSWRNLIGSNPEGDMAVTETVMKHYKDMGIKGFKVDFFDRDDQQAIASAYQIAEMAARHQLYLDLHGLKPFGIQRAYPNIFNFEGVKGLENSKWEPRVGNGPLHNQPRYDVSAPYLRMLAGPMDYTPGAMTNAMRNNFFGNNDNPMSQGTRVHQMAMYTTFEAPLQMLADSPTKYMQNQECTDFIAQVPTTFDETVALDGKLGEYTVVARRKGATWYVAAMTDWTARDLTIDLSFLGNGQHQADIFADGVNAQKEASDYKHTKQAVTASDKLKVHLSSGGGWTAIITK